MHHLGDRRLVGCVIAHVLALTLIASHASADSQSVPEYNAKAGFLTAFVNYASWPADAFASVSAPVMLCVLGHDPFADVLDKTAAVSRGTRQLQVRRIETPGLATGCQIIFISKTESRHEAEWLAALKGKAVLTVGESERTVEHGGTVAFATSGDRVVFDVSLPAAGQVGIKLSSDLLAHARKVYR